MMVIINVIQCNANTFTIMTNDTTIESIFFF